MLIVEDGVKGSSLTRFSDYESIRPDEQQLCDKHAPSVFCLVRVGPYTIVRKPPNKPSQCVLMVRPQIRDFIKGWVKGTDEEVLKNLIG